MIEILGIIVLIIFVFIFGGLLGWILKLLSYVVEFLWEGLTNIFSFVFWCIAIIIILYCLL